MVNKMGVDLFVNPKSLRAAILLKMKKEQIEKYSDDVIGIMTDSPVVVSPSWEDLYRSANLYSRVKPDFISFVSIRFTKLYYDIPSARVKELVRKHANEMLRAVGLSPKSFSFRVS